MTQVSQKQVDILVSRVAAQVHDAQRDVEDEEFTSWDELDPLHQVEWEHYARPFVEATITLLLPDRATKEP